MPLELKKRWRKTLPFHETEGWFVDKTNDFYNFPKTIFKSPRNYRQTLDKHPIPDVKCPEGCLAFIDKYQKMPFQQCLNTQI